MCMDELQFFVDVFDGKGVYWFFIVVDIEGVGVEIFVCCFQLDKGFVLVKEMVLFWWDEFGEIQYVGYIVVFIFFVRSEVIEFGYGVLLFWMVLVG